MPDGFVGFAFLQRLARQVVPGRRGILVHIQRLVDECLPFGGLPAHGFDNAQLGQRFREVRVFLEGLLEIAGSSVELAVPQVQHSQVVGSLGRSVLFARHFEEEFLRFGAWRHLGRVRFEQRHGFAQRRGRLSRLGRRLLRGRGRFRCGCGCARSRSRARWRVLSHCRACKKKQQGR